MTTEDKRLMVRKQFLITIPQNLYLQRCAEDSGESEGHFVREAIAEHARKHRMSLKMKLSATH